MVDTTWIEIMLSILWVVAAAWWSLRFIARVDYMTLESMGMFTGRRKGLRVPFVTFMAVSGLVAPMVLTP